MSLADEYGTDLEIYRRTPSRTIYADTRTGAPEELLRLLDVLGFQRHEAPPLAVWHQLPDALPEDAQHRIASRTAAGLTTWGYTVNIDPQIFDQDAYEEALAGPNRRLTAQQKNPAPAPAPPAGPAHKTR